MKTLRLQDKLVKQNFHDNMKKVYPLVTKSLNDVSEAAKTMTEASIANNKTLAIINDKLLEIMNDRGSLASCFLSPLSRITNVEHTSQLKLVKDLDSKRDRDLIINRTIQITLYNNLLTLRDTDIKLELNREILKMISNQNCNIDLAN